MGDDGIALPDGMAEMIYQRSVSAGPVRRFIARRYGTWPPRKKRSCIDPTSANQRVGINNFVLVASTSSDITAFLPIMSTIDGFSNCASQQTSLKLQVIRQAHHRVPSRRTLPPPPSSPFPHSLSPNPSAQLHCNLPSIHSAKPLSEPRTNLQHFQPASGYQCEIHPIPRTRTRQRESDDRKHTRTRWTV